MLTVPKNVSLFTEIINWLNAFLNIRQVHPSVALALRINGDKAVAVQDVKIYMNFFSLFTSAGEYFFMNDDIKAAEVSDEFIRIATTDNEFFILFNFN